MADLIIIGLIIFLASAVQGLSGFGAGLVAMPLLALMLNIRVATPFVAMINFVIVTIMFVQLKRHFSLRRLVPLAVGCLFGVPVGVYLLKNVDERLIKAVIGAVLIMYALFSLSGMGIKKSLGSAWGYFFGFLSGCLGGAFNITGPPAVVYTMLKSWNKDEIKVTLQSFFTACKAFVIIVLALNGLMTREVLRYFIFCVPPAVAGVFTGTFFYRKINQENFKRAIYFLLLAFGVLMLVRQGRAPLPGA